MTLNDLLIDCCTRLNYAPDLTLVDAKVKARLTAFLNQTQLEILGQPSYRRLLTVKTPLVTLAGEHRYGLPPFVERIVSVVDPRNQRRLGVMSTDMYRRYQPNPAVSTGTPDAYAFDGWGAMQFLPKAPTEGVYVFSSAPDDGKKITARIVQSNAIPAQELWRSITVTLNAAASGVELVPPASVPYDVTDITLDAPALGAVALYDAKPPTRFLSQIPPGSARPRYPVIYLMPTPSGAQTFEVAGERPVLPLVLPADESVIPPRFHYILAAGARMKEYELRGDTSRYAVAKREYDLALGFLNAWVSDQPDAGDITVPDDRRSGGPSVLGPWFPVSRYRGY